MHKYSNTETNINNCLDTYSEETVERFVNEVSALLESLTFTSLSVFTFKKSAIQNTHEISFDITGTIPTRQLSKFKNKYPRSKIEVINNKQVLLVPKKLVTSLASASPAGDNDSEDSMDEDGEPVRQGKRHTAAPSRRCMLAELGAYSAFTAYVAYRIIVDYLMPSELFRALSQVRDGETDG